MRVIGVKIKLFFIGLGRICFFDRMPEIPAKQLTDPVSVTPDPGIRPNPIILLLCPATSLGMGDDFLLPKTVCQCYVFVFVKLIVVIIVFVHISVILKVINTIFRFKMG